MSSTENEPFHTFPESRYQTLCSVVIPLACLGLIVFGILHCQSEPHLKELLRQSTFRGRFYIIFLCYLLPFVLIFIALGTDVSLGFLVVAVLLEVSVNVYLLVKTQRERLYPRLGRRVLFVSMCVLFGAGFLTEQYNSIDYYGPVRVTGVGLEFDRPEQKIDIAQPRYYYYYRLQQTLEWGDSWGCPSLQSDQWCSTSEELYRDTCKKRINCQGRPEDEGDNGLGECATRSQRGEALVEIYDCWKKMAKNDGLLPQEFSSTNFTKETAPWEDPLQPHTVTRAVSCDNDCKAQNTPPPKVMAHEAFLEWFAGFILVLVGCGLLVLGVVSGQEQQAITSPASFQQVAHAEPSYDLELREHSSSTIPVAQEVAHEKPSHDLELCQQSNSNIPMAHVIPMT